MSTRKNGVRDGCQRYYCTNCNREFRGLLQEDADSRVLVIPDTHSPFMMDGFLDFLWETKEKFNCNKIVHLGDEIDFHASSRHTSDPDGMSAGEELEKAVEQLGLMAAMFPEMSICFGNHTRIPQRQAYEFGLSKRMVKTVKDVYLELGINVKGWEYSDHFEIDNVKYVHGEGRQAKQRMQQDGISIVQGHYHSRSGIDWLVNKYQCNYAMQLGAGINDKAYAFAYSKNFAKSITNCGVILDGGRLPLIVTMRR